MPKLHFNLLKADRHFCLRLNFVLMDASCPLERFDEPFLPNFYW